LCGSTARWRGLWVPTPEASRRLGAPAGKLRVTLCTLCPHCAALPAVTTRVEDVILADAAARLARPEAN
jgi:hypothetical protein